MTPAWTRLAAIVARFAGGDSDPDSRKLASSSASGDWIQLISALTLAFECFQSGRPPERADAAYLWGVRCAFRPLRATLEAALLFLGIEDPVEDPPDGRAPGLPSEAALGFESDASVRDDLREILAAFDLLAQKLASLDAVSFGSERFPVSGHCASIAELLNGILDLPYFATAVEAEALYRETSEAPAAGSSHDPL